MAMFKRLLQTVFPFAVKSRSDHSRPSDEARAVDPEDMLYSIPTLCDPGPATDATPPPAGYHWLDEDAWLQIEFVPQANLGHIEGELATLLAFEQRHRRGAGWTDVYVRKEHPTPFATVGLHFASLPALPASFLAIGDGPPWGGTVVGGFALSDGGDWFIYGQRTDDGHVVHLAVSRGRSVPSEQLAHALSQIAQTAGLLLVDWCARLLIDTSSPESVLARTRRYQ